MGSDSTRRTSPGARVPRAPGERYARRALRGFTLVELLVVVGIIGLLVAVLVPTLAGARAQAKKAVCASNLRQLLMATMMYAHEQRGAMPPCGWSGKKVQGYWWGQISAGRIDHTISPLYTYLRSRLDEEGVFECPDQPWGTYRPQPMGLPGQVTSTYGYNGYYLTPAATPGWSMTIRRRPWQKVETIQSPGLVFAFADTLIDFGDGEMPANNALLDPPYLYQAGYTSPYPPKEVDPADASVNWRVNPSPTTVFRHRGETNAACCDGHVESFGLEEGILTSPRHKIGSVGQNNGPHYVPDWRQW